MALPPDDQLLQAAMRGAPDALGELIARCGPLLRRDLERRTGPGVKRFVSLSDLEQEILLRVQSLLDRLRPGACWEDFQALLQTHARWVVQNAARSRQQFEGESVATEVGARPAGQDPPTGAVTRSDEARWMERQLEGLDPELAEVTRLRLQQTSFAEIAGSLSISEATARRRFYEAARILRARRG